MNLAATVTLLLLIVLTAAGSIVVTDLVGAVFILGSYSFFLALLWAWQGAVDVAFTEAVVGAGLSTIFFVLTFFVTAPKDSEIKPHHTTAPAMIGLAALGLFLVYGALDLPVVGDPASPANRYLSPEYLGRSLAETLTPNVVTSILMDYRSFDTVIETTVIFTAGIASALLLRRTH